MMAKVLRFFISFWNFMFTNCRSGMTLPEGCKSTVNNVKEFLKLAFAGHEPASRDRNLHGWNKKE